MDENNSPLERLLDWCAGEVESLRLSHKIPSTGEIDDDEVRQEIEQVEADIAALSTEGSGGGEQHQWDRDGERCVKCGAKDWMNTPCHPPDDTPPGNDALNESHVTATRALTYLGYLLNSALCGGYEPHQKLYQYHQAVRSILVKLQEDEYYTPPQWREALAIVERQLFRIAAQGIMDDPKVPEAFDTIRHALAQQNSAENKHSYAVPEALLAPEKIVDSRAQIKWWEDMRCRVDFGVDADWTSRIARTALAFHDLKDALAQHSEPERGECGWSLDDEGSYHTDCGTEFVSPDYLTLDEMPSMRYCSNCGRRIRDDGRMGDA